MIEAGKVEELRTAVPRLYDQARKAAGQAGIEAVIRPWFATYPQPERDEDEWAAFWHGYVVTCEHHSEAALRGAMVTWAKRPDAEFLPKPGVLGEIAKTTPTPAFRLAGHAYQVLQKCDDLQERYRIAADMEDRGVKAPEQAAAVAGMLAGFQHENAAVRERGQRILQRGWKHADKPLADGPYIGGTPPAGHGITREMMRVLGRAEPAETSPGYLDEAPAFSEEAGG